MKLVSGQLMAQIDRYAIDQVGIPGIVLMENAGKGVYNEFINNFNPEKSSSILIICGKGNNGGDGFVVARHLFNNNFKNLKIILLTKSENLKGDALINYQICKNMALNIEEVTNYEQFFNIVKDYNFNFIFDAILGTGLKSEVRDFYKKIIDYINNNNAKVIAIDIPSGLHSEQGVPLGTCTKADITCTFAYKKIGLSTYPGCLYAGKVKVIDISIPEKVPFNINFFEIDEDMLKNFYKKRAVDSHKGTFGHVLIFGGSIGFTGAPVLAAKAALLAGCGLVTSIIPEEINKTVESLFIEGMSYPVDFLNYDLDELIKFINSKSAILIGPGLNTSEASKKIFLDIIKYIEIPMVIDADGLNILSENIEIINELKIPPILTPHPGEMSRLTKISTKKIQQNRINTVKNFINNFNSTLILKGYKTIIGSNDNIYICPKGDSALATAGSGDVLSGIIVSLLAQGYSATQAALLGTYLHGLSGEIAEQKKCNTSVIASDILKNLHYSFKILFGENDGYYR